MKKMNMPEGAIRQKMSAEGFKPDEIDAFISGAPMPTVSEAPVKDAKDPKFAKFTKMKEMNLPEGAIRQKMVAEGLSVADIDAFFSGAPSVAPLAADDPKFAKFAKMKAMNMPEGAIRQKMAVEKFTPAEIDAFLTGSPLPAPSNQLKISPDDPKFEMYLKMKKMNMPEGAIRQKMMANGLTSAEMDLFFGGGASCAGILGTN
jgi:hypothetical protein